MEKNKRDVIKLGRVLVLTNWGGFAAKGANFSGNLSFFDSLPDGCDLTSKSKNSVY